MSLTTILPDNATALEIALERVLVSRLNGIASPFPSLWRPDEADLGVLPWLAEAVGVSEWVATASEAEKRASVAAQWPNARQGGMGAALKRAIDPLGVGVLVRPWYEIGADPYQFEIEINLSGKTLDPVLLARVEQRVSDAKSERDNYTLSIVIEDVVGAVSEENSSIFFNAVFTDKVVIEAQPFIDLIESGPE